MKVTLELEYDDLVKLRDVTATHVRFFDADDLVGQMNAAIAIARVLPALRRSPKRRKSHCTGGCGGDCGL
jgi:hypothetical protein